MLSFAGKITLTKAVLSSILVRTMSTIRLPASTLNSLVRVSRDFIWGITTEKKKQHLLSWERVCIPKKKRGLGIRKVNDE